jgi:hypothetical protein
MAQQSQFRINGIIDTTKNCLSNIDALCRSAGCFATYDTTTGLWSVILNTTGISKYSFNDNNIIGGITVSGTGIDQLYNSVEVQYPLTDISGARDNQNLQIDTANWYPNELPKKMSIQLDLINNPVQAQFIGQVELKQNRLDKIITFTTDYSGLTLRAGNLIDVTNANYGYTNKMFRIISMVETDDDTGIKIQITALEYDATVYDTTGLTYTNTVTANGVVPAYNNAAVGNSLDQYTGQALKRLGVNAFDSAHAGVSGAITLQGFRDCLANGFPGLTPVNGLQVIQRYFFNLSQTAFTGLSIKAFELVINLAYGNWSYAGGSIDGYFPCIVQMYYSSTTNAPNPNVPTSGFTLIATQYANNGAGSGQVSFVGDYPSWGYYQFMIIPTTYKAPGVGNLTPTSFNTIANDKQYGTATSAEFLIWYNATV